MELNFWQVLSLLHPLWFRGSPWPSAWDFMSVCGRPDTKVLFLEGSPTTKNTGREDVALLGTAGADRGHPQTSQKRLLGTARVPGSHTPFMPPGGQRKSTCCCPQRLLGSRVPAVRV